MDFEEFSKDSKTIDAVIRNFEIIGEAANRLPEDFKGIFSAVWDYPTGSTTGHADLLNSISPWCDGRCHLNEKHKYIDIWPLQ